MGFDPSRDAHLPPVRDRCVVPVAVRVVLVLVERCPEPGAGERVVPCDQVSQPEFLPLGGEDVPAVERELETPRFHDHFEPETEHIGPAHHPINGTEVFEIELIESRRLLAATPRPGAPRLPVAVPLRRVKRAHRHSNAQQVEPLARPALEKRVDIDAAVCHPEKVVGRFAEHEDRLAALEREPPTLSRSRGEKPTRFPRRDLERPAAIEVRITWHGNEPVRPSANFAGVEPNLPGAIAVVKCRHAHFAAGRSGEEGIDNHIGKGTSIVPGRREPPLADRPVVKTVRIPFCLAHVLHLPCVVGRAELSPDHSTCGPQ